MTGTGIVVAVDEMTCRVRVEFPGHDDGEGTALVSNWLPVAQRKTLGDTDYWLPDEGTQVVCVLDAHCEEGVVVGAIYSDADAPPIASKDKFYRRFKDGSTIVYDRAQHKLSANIQGDVDLEATGHTLIKSGQGVDIDGGPGNVKGAVQGDCICAYTGQKHPMISDNVKTSL